MVYIYILYIVHTCIFLYVSIVSEFFDAHKIYLNIYVNTCLYFYVIF